MEGAAAAGGSHPHPGGLSPAPLPWPSPGESHVAHRTWGPALHRPMCVRLQAQGSDGSEFLSPETKGQRSGQGCLCSVGEPPGKSGCPPAPHTSRAQSAHQPLGSLFCRNLSLLMGWGSVGFGVSEGPRETYVITPAPYPHLSPRPGPVHASRTEGPSRPAKFQARWQAGSRPPTSPVSFSRWSGAAPEDTRGLPRVCCQQSPPGRTTRKHRLNPNSGPALK